MTFDFRDAKREDVRLLILLAGGTGSGKTESAMRLATGLGDGKPFAVIDTERGRALHKADDYNFKHAELDAPFSPERYAEAVTEADAAGFGVVVIDSGSHEYEGPGGVLDIQEQEFERLGRRDSARMSSWIPAKSRHKRFVQQLLRVNAHVILCLRAEDKIEIVKEGDRTVVRPKHSLVGAQGWVPICEKRLPFEATISLLLLQSNPGVPVPIKLERRHADLVALDSPVSEETGRRLAEWAAGGSAQSNGGAPEAAEITQTDRRTLFGKAREAGLGEDGLRALVKEVTGLDSTAGMTVAQYREVLSKIAEPESQPDGGSESVPADSSGSAVEAGAADRAASAADQPEGEPLFQAPDLRPDRERGE